MEKVLEVAVTHRLEPLWQHLGDALVALHQLHQLVYKEPWPKEQACELVDQIHEAWSALVGLNDGVFRMELVSKVAPIHGCPSEHGCSKEEDGGKTVVQLARVRCCLESQWACS